ncbi:MAG: carbon-nitrogen hydrolase family protein [Kiritimatiellae bacterium]|nr:carbon-nitrogen hydrolase family protein [Kiritimatiellia bacterium]
MKRIVFSCGLLAAFSVFGAPSPEAPVRREIAVSVIGLQRPEYPVAEESVERVIEYWKRGMDREIGNRPDLIVLPECCDTLPAASADQAVKARWTRMRGTRVLDAMRAYANEHSCYIVYASHRVRDDGRFANSSFLVDRAGKVAAVYDKVFPTAGEAESGECPVVPGTEAVVADTDFGRVGFVICFDLNFTELMKQYAAKRPDVLVFSSMFDGDFLQRNWARECQSYVVSSTGLSILPGRVIGPAGEELRNENYYMPTFTAKINTNCRVLHLDFNRDKFPAVIAKYGRRVEFRNPGGVGTFTLLSHDPALPVDEVMREFGLEPFTDYMIRSRTVRETSLRRVAPGR